MPILEVDLLYAAMDTEDRHNKIAEKVLKLIRDKILVNVKVDSLALHELELNLKSGNILIERKQATNGQIATFFRELDRLLTLYGADAFPLTCEEISKAAQLREDHDLTFYDSHHASAALLFDSKIISIDKAYDGVKRLRRIDPYKISQESS